MSVVHFSAGDSRACTWARRIESWRVPAVPTFTGCEVSVSDWLPDDFEPGPARYDVHCVVCRERETQCRCYS